MDLDQEPWLPAHWHEDELPFEPDLYSGTGDAL